MAKTPDVEIHVHVHFHYDEEEQLPEEYSEYLDDPEEESSDTTD